jgi:predicted ester cyclase
MRHDNAALARKWFEQVWKPGGEAVAREMLHPEALGHMEGGDVRGVDEFLAVRTQLLAAMPDMVIDVDDLIADGDRVAVRWTVTATHGGDAFGLRATQQALRFRGISWLLFGHDGRLVEGWDAWNQGQLMNVMANPPAAAARV